MTGQRRFRWARRAVHRARIAVVLLACAGFPRQSEAGEEPSPRAASPLLAGAARADVTPPAGLPLWGYGGRKDAPARGARDPLSAGAVVLVAGGTKLAIVGLDAGRAPARRTMAAIREEVLARAGVRHVFVVGSHTHHGPCLELETAGATADYTRELARKIAGAIVDAAAAARPVRIAIASGEVRRNRNRHSKVRPAPVDRELTALRLVDLEGEPVAVIVNYAAHPTTLPAELLEWSADYPGALRSRIEERLGGICVFLQGAVGDLSCDRQGLDTARFGQALADDALALISAVEPVEPRSVSLAVREEAFRFESRVDHRNPLVYLQFCVAFFKDLVDAYLEEYRDGVRPEISVALLRWSAAEVAGEGAAAGAGNGREAKEAGAERGGSTHDIGFVGASGEIFASHALRLRERSRLEHLVFSSCCNGYHQYFPTIEAVAEGGYGADKEMAPAEVGAGERMMDRALIHLFELRKSAP